MELLIAADSVPIGQRDIAPLVGTPEWATDGDPTAGPPIPPTIWPAWAWNMVVQELINVVDAAGLTRSRTDWTQLLQAFRVLGPVTATDTGSANAMVIMLTPVPVSLASLAGRIFIVTKSAAQNTGNVTLNANGTGAAQVLTAQQTQLFRGQWPANALGILYCTGTSFILLNDIAQVAQGAWNYITANALILPAAYLADTTSGGFTLTLQAAPALGDNYQFRDPFNSWAAIPLIIDPNGKTIAGQAGQMLCNLSGQPFSLAYQAGDYVVKFDV